MRIRPGWFCALPWGPPSRRARGPVVYTISTLCEGTGGKLKILVALFAAIVLCVGGPAIAAEEVAVGLFYGDSAPRAVVISGRGRLRGRTASGTFDGELRLRVRGRDVVAETGSGERRVGEWMELSPAEGESWLELGDYAYRGRLRIEVQRNGRLKVVNILGVEDYVKGVVPNEMFANAEAYKAQAVVARTLALYVRDHERRHRGDGFDLCTSGHCQVYRGVDSETPLSNQAVEETAGQILTYRGRPILAAYHANAGGATDEVDEVWPGSIRKDFPYLAAFESPFDRAANKLSGYQWCYRWKRTISLSGVAERLAARGQKVGKVRDLVVRKRSRSNRVKELEVIGSRGRARVVGTMAVSRVLGTPSSKLHLKKSGGRFIAEGWGYGDGVGMSQQGALGMAWEGYDYAQILGFYYRGVSLTEDYGRGRSRPLSVPTL